MSFDAHCPRCGATLPQEDEVLCPGCGNAIGNRTVAIEVSPEELIAEAARRAKGAATDAGTDLEASNSVVTTTLSGLLQTEPGAEALALSGARDNNSRGPVALIIGVLAVLLAVALALVFLFGR